MYAHFFKRIFDFFLSLIALVLLSPILLFLMILGSIKMRGNPFFVQPRPGKDEKIFYLIKFRTMTNEKDAEGNLLPDEKRLVPYGKLLRSTSLDELPELINILKGDMAIVGPRPLLIRDMIFMTKDQRKRHTVRSGLTGLAQVSGRNAINWEEKLTIDLKYINRITFFGDFIIILKTIGKVFDRDGINEEGMATATDLCDYLLCKGLISQKEYDQKMVQVANILMKTKRQRTNIRGKNENMVN